MNGKPAIILNVILFGLLCMAAKQTGIEGEKVNVSYQRPLYKDNQAAVKGGVIAVTLPGGEYVIDRDDVISASASTYLMEGGMRVWEVMITERSSHVVRFYYTRPKIMKGEDKEGEVDEKGKLTSESDAAGGADKTEEAQDKESDAKDATCLWAPVRKEYPATTHLPMTEFRLTSLKSLEVLYQGIARQVWGWSPMSEGPREFKALDFEGWADWRKKE